MVETFNFHISMSELYLSEEVKATKFCSALIVNLNIVRPARTMYYLVAAIQNASH